jgi:hypothetical protein
MAESLVFDLVGRDNASVAFDRVAKAAEKLSVVSAAARSELQRLGSTRTDVRITTNADTAVAKIKAVQTAADKANKPTLGLGTALLALGPAAIPVTAVAGGALAGLAPLAGTALLAVKGLENAFKSGTLAGTAFGKNLAAMQSELTRLEQTAAGGVLTGLNKGIVAIQPQLPLVNKDVAALSSRLGDIAGHVGPGFVSLFVRTQPLMQTFSSEIDKGAASFQHWAQSSSSVSSFVSYAQRELPVVASTLTNLASTAGHAIQAFAPFGSTTLQGINLLSAGLNKIPVSVLQGVVPVISGAFLGGKIGGVVAEAGNKLQGWSQKAQDASGVAGDLSGVAGKLGKVLGHAGTIGAIAGVGLGLMSSAMGFLSRGAQEAQTRINNLTTAMQNGTLTTEAWKNAQATGATAAVKLGVSQQTLLDGITGSTAKYKEAQSAVERYGRAAVASATVDYQFGASARDVSNSQAQLNDDLSRAKDGLAESRKEYLAAKTALASWATQQGDAGLAAQIASGQYANAARALGVTAGAYLTAKLTADQNVASTKAQTLAFQLENDAASLMNQSLATMAGQALGNAQAQTAMDQAMLTVTSTLKTNKGAMSEHTTAGLADRQAIEGAVSALRSKATAEASATGSTEKATAQYGVNAKALLAMIGRLDGTKSAAYKYAEQLLALPAVVKTRLDLAGDAQAKLIAISNQMFGLNNKTFRTYLQVQTNVKGQQAMAAPYGLAAGGSLPEGISAVGERGAELAVKRGANVEILSNPQSRAFLAVTGMSAPGFANGTTSSRAALAASPPASRTTGLGQLIAELRQVSKDQGEVIDALVDVAAAMSHSAQRPINLDGKPLQDLTDQRIAGAVRKLTAVKKHGRRQ